MCVANKNRERAIKKVESSLVVCRSCDPLDCLNPSSQRYKNSDDVANTKKNSNSSRPSTAGNTKINYHHLTAQKTVSLKTRSGQSISKIVFN